MILRPGLPLHLLSGAVFLLSLAPAAVLAQETFDCKITIGESKWDLTSLAGERTLSRDRDTPPTKFTDVVKFNLCEDLKKDEELADKDQVSRARWDHTAVASCGGVLKFALASAWMSSVQREREHV